MKFAIFEFLFGIKKFTKYEVNQLWSIGPTAVIRILKINFAHYENESTPRVLIR